jgi:hypothetical protein
LLASDLRPLTIQLRLLEINLPAPLFEIRPLAS